MTEYPLHDSTPACCLELPIPPYGNALIVGDDTSEDSKVVLRMLESDWNELWPEMLSQLKETMENLDLEIDLSELEFRGRASRMTPGFWLADKSDIFLSFNFGDVPGWDSSPNWDYFIRGAKVVHFQPVF
jgi:hypothetical protein